MYEIASLLASYDASNRLHIVVICDRGFKTELLFLQSAATQIGLNCYKFLYVTLFSLQNN